MNSRATHDGFHCIPSQRFRESADNRFRTKAIRSARLGASVSPTSLQARRRGPGNSCHTHYDLDSLASDHPKPSLTARQSSGGPPLPNGGPLSFWVKESPELRAGLCIWMPGNMNKWVSRHRKIVKSGHRVAAEMIPFPRWHGGMISANLEAIWGMSVKAGRPRRPLMTLCGHSLAGSGFERIRGYPPSGCLSLNIPNHLSWSASKSA